MLFYTDLEFNGVKKPFVLTARVDDGNDIRFYTFKNMLNDRAIYPILKYNSDIINYDGVEGFDKIIIVCNPANRARCVNFTAVFNMLITKLGIELGKNVFDMLASKLNTSSNNIYKLTGRDIEVFFNAMKELEDYKNGKLNVNYDIAKEGLINTDITVPIIDKSKTDLAELSFIKDGKNEDLFMENPDSEVFIKLSTYEDIVMNDSACYTSLTKVFIPFRNAKLYTPNYKSVIQDGFDMKSLYGDVDNNDLDIQPNESYFYNAMKELINYGIEQEYPNNTLDECIESNLSSKRVRVYLEELACRVAAVNWGFTGNYPISRFASLNFNNIGDGEDSDYNDLDFEDDNNDDADTVEDLNNTAEGNKKYFPRGDNEAVPGFDYILTEIIEQASLSNIYAPAEAVIRLLRWGNRKPTRLKLEGLKGYFDLQTGKVSELSGSLVGLQVKKQDGATYVPYKIIKSPSKIKDIKYARSLDYNNQTLGIPIGIVCAKEFMNGMKQHVCFFIPTLIKYLKENPNDIKGITYINNELKLDRELDSLEIVPLDNAINLINLSASGEVIANNSEEFIDSYLVLGLYSKNTTELAVIENYLEMNDVNVELDSKAADNPNELAEKYLKSQGLSMSDVDPKTIKTILSGNQSVKPFIDASYAKKVLPIIIDVAGHTLDLRRQGLRANLQETFDLYLSAMIKHNAVKAEEILNSTDTQSMNLFNSNETEEQRMERERNEMRNFLIREIPTGAKLVNLCSKAHDAVVDAKGNVTKPKIPAQEVGYVYIGVSGNSKYYVLTNRLPQGCTVMNSRIALEQIVKVAVSDSYNLLVGNRDSVKIFYENESAWANLAETITKFVR